MSRSWKPSTSPLRLADLHKFPTAMMFWMVGILLALPVALIPPRVFAALPPGSQTVRVLLSTHLGATPNFDHDTVELIAPHGLRVVERPQSSVDQNSADQGSGRELGVAPPESKVLFTASDDGVMVRWPTGDVQVAAEGVLVEPVKLDEPVGVPTLRRPKSNPYPAYRGRMEVKPSWTPGKLRLINHLNFEEYLKGILPNEMPVNFAVEALKAQATAARGYALSRLGNYGADADICDSEACQVYYGARSEHPVANAALDQTHGLVITFEGRVISAVYSSTAGGHTESAENVWAMGGQFPGLPTPYLTGVSDGFKEELGLDLTEEEGARAFLEDDYGEFDQISPHHRWTEVWTREQLEATLNTMLAQRSAVDPNAVTPYFTAGDSVGTLISLRPLRRGVSGRIMELEITGTNGKWVVSKELNIRYVLKPQGGALLKSAAVVFDNGYDETGKLLGVMARGAGFGHGVGMSQWGAHGMALLGYSFTEILRHYYQGVEIGTLPAELRVGETTVLTFVAPSQNARLIISNRNVGHLVIRFNGHITVNYDLSQAAWITYQEAIGPYLQEGLNRVELESTTGEGTVTVQFTLCPCESATR